jgi:hypothetical protein
MGRAASALSRQPRLTKVDFVGCSDSAMMAFANSARGARGKPVLEKIKDLSAQVASKAGVAMVDLAATVKDGAESLASTASSMTGTLNEKAVRASTAQMCSILEMAVQELHGRELSRRPVTLTASVTVGIASLQMQVHLDPGTTTSTDLAVPPTPPSAELAPAGP